jgi:hypothetical protein
MFCVPERILISDNYIPIIAASSTICLLPSTAMRNILVFLQWLKSLLESRIQIRKQCIRIALSKCANAVGKTCKFCRTFLFFITICCCRIKQFRILLSPCSADSGFAYILVFCCQISSYPAVLVILEWLSLWLRLTPVPLKFLAYHGVLACLFLPKMRRG